MPAAVPDRALRPHDWYLIFYLALTLPLPIIFSDRLADPYTLPIYHAVGILVLLGLRLSAFAATRIGRFLLCVYPVVLVAFLYTEVGTLCRLIVPDRFFDDLVQQWELRMFGEQLAQTLYVRLDSRVLGEYLHFAYLFYYLVPTTMVLTLWFRVGRRQAEVAIGTVMMTFICGFLVFIVFPVTGPYHQFERLPIEPLGFFVPEISRWFVDRGSSIGAAFPSSHVAVAVVAWLMAIRYHPVLANFFALIVPALAVGAVYGGFHYAIDAVAGAVLGLLVGTGGWAITDRIYPRARPFEEIDPDRDDEDESEELDTIDPFANEPVDEPVS